MLFDGYLICSDIDGTLTYNGKISEKNRNAIDYFMKNGGIFTIATGRLPGYISEIIGDFMPNAPVITLNGTAVYDLEKNKLLFENPLPNDCFKIIKYACDNFDFIHTVYFSNKNGRILWSKESGKSVEVIDTTEIRHKLVMQSDTAQHSNVLKKALIERFSDEYKFDHSWDTGLEAHILGSGKGEIINELIRHIKKPVRTIVTIGDYENDISMLKRADIAFCPENAIAEAKAEADYILPANNNDAVYHMIKKLGDECIENKQSV